MPERSHLLSVLLAFTANGLQAGVYTVLIADLVGSPGLSFGALGVASASLSAASIPSVLLTGRLADRLGRRLELHCRSL